MPEAANGIPSALPKREEVRWLAETTRKRKYRAKKHQELVDLEAQVRRLTACLAHLHGEIRAQQLAQAKEEKTRLRMLVSQYSFLMQIFSHLVHVNDHPKKDLSLQSTWMQSTLLAHPISRRQGIQWLSERVFHLACQAAPHSQTLDGHIYETLTLDVHLSDEIDDEGTSISALESRYKYTMYSDFESVAREYWNAVIESNAAISRELIERVDDRFIYYHQRDHLKGANLLTVAGFFKQQDRIVVTYCYLARDELFPPEENILLSPGFSWTVFEATRPDTTLVHNLSLYGTPSTRDGHVIPLERIGRFFGRPSFGIQHREAYIELVRASAERALTHSHNSWPPINRS
ncbi:hypothetical protein LEN26_019136 [Aphanomyces euteiches]|nr:hypothetical protein LEN26_019136 [Aphanomyces euteiches]